MKILLATSFFPPTHTAGTEKRTLGYSKMLLERGHLVQVICAGQWDEGGRYWNGHSDEVYQGIPVRRIHLNWKKSPDPNAYLYNNPETARFLDQCLAEWQPDLVHITSCLTLSASIIAASKRHHLPVILTLTDYWFLCHKISLLRYDGLLCDGITTSLDCIRCLCWDSGIHQKLRKISSEPVATLVLDALSKYPAISRQRGLRGLALDISGRKAYLLSMLNAVDVVIAPSKHLRQTFLNSGVSKEIHVIQSGHDLSWLHNGRAKTISPCIRFGYIGQFIPTKGVHLLLEAFGMQDWQRQAELHLYGNHESDATYWRELQQIENRNPESLFLHGSFPHEKVGEVLSNLDVLVVPSSWHENNPRVIQEAFAGGIPVIASDVGGIAEYVMHEVNGLLFRRGDSADLRAQLRRLVDQPELLANITLRVPRVKTISEEMDELESIYFDLMSHLEESL